MNGIDNPIVFYPSAILIIIFSLLAIKCKNIFYSLLSAIVVFFLAGLFFYVLGSEYNAVIQIAVYGFAVPVILGVAIMFTNLKVDVGVNNIKLNYIMFLTSGIFILALIYLFLISNLIVPIDFHIISDITAKSVVTLQDFANRIFRNYVWAFELMSFILTIIVVGLTLFKKARRGG